MTGPNSHYNLSELRKSLRGEKILSLAAEAPIVLINAPIGAGKSYSIDNTIEAALHGEAYDLIVVLAPTRAVLEERRLLKTNDHGVRVMNMRPRPVNLCGKTANQKWSKIETMGLGAYGRATICKFCLYKSECYWLLQRKEKLKGVQVVFATQTHLQNSSDFLYYLQHWTQSRRALILIDEGNIITAPFKRMIGTDDLTRFQTVIDSIVRTTGSTQFNDLSFYISTLQAASTIDLRRPDWKLRALGSKDVLKIQFKGMELFQDTFRFIERELIEFGKSPPDSREKLPDGSIRFAMPPSLNQRIVFFSGTTQPKLMSFRLGQEIKHYPETPALVSSGSKFYNIASRSGMASYFPGNSSQIYDFVADLLTLRISEGKRMVLLSRKKFIQESASEIQKRLKANGLKNYTVIDPKDKRFAPGKTKQIPIIHYGMIGVNRFEDYDGICCINGFYINEDILNGVLQDIQATDFHIPIMIRTNGIPLRRKAGAISGEDQIFDTHRMAQIVLDDLEMGGVLQAIGRVRPFTKPREVITFQCAELPGYKYDAEFRSITEARQFFGFKNRREKAKNESHRKVQECKQKGMTKTAAAKETGLSLRTVGRHW